MKPKSAKKLLTVFIGFLLTHTAGAIEFRVDSLTASTGTQVLVPVRAFDFNKILSLQGTIEFDQNVIAYNSISQFGLPGMNNTNFGTGQAANGRVAYLWDDGTLQGLDLTDSTIIFEIRFDVIGTFGQLSSICFANSVAPLEVVDTSFTPLSNVGYVCGNLQIPGGSNPVANASKTDISCFGADDGTASVSVSGGTAPYTYEWSHGPTTPSVTGLQAGTYFVTATDFNSLTDTATVIITEPAALSTSIISSDVSSCTVSDGSATVLVSGGTTPYSYLWSNNGTAATISNLAGGTYTVQVTDDRGCAISDTAVISAPSSVSASIASPTDVSCFGGNDGAAQVNASGGNLPYSYSWSNGATTSSISSLTAGNYIVTVSDNSNCNATATVFIDQPAQLLVSTSVTDVSCQGDSNGSATANVSGGTGPFDYLWSNNATTAAITNQTADSYSVTVTDDNGCTALAGATINEPATSLTISTSVSNVICNGGNDGSATAVVSGGTTPYAYSWSNGATTATISNLSDNVYSVVVTDDGGCTVAGSAVVTEPSPITISLAVTDVSVHGGSDGAINLTVSGGLGGYSYAWSNGSSTQDISGLTAGPYDVVVTDANGCEANDSETVTEPVSVFNLTNSQEVKIFPNPSDGSFDVLVEGKEKFTEVRLLDLLGQVVYSLELTPATFAAQRISIQTDLQNGMYVLRLIGSGYSGNAIVMVRD